MSIYDKLKCVCKFRVYIIYDVEIEGVIVKKEFFFVVGVMGDFLGYNKEVLKFLKDCCFI